MLDEFLNSSTNIIYLANFYSLSKEINSIDWFYVTLIHYAKLAYEYGDLWFSELLNQNFLAEKFLSRRSSSFIFYQNFKQ